MVVEEGKNKRLEIVTLQTEKDKESNLQLEVIKLQAKEAAGFYQTITVTASGFLGGTLLFMKEIAPNPNPHSIYSLFLGWFLLVASIGCVTYVRRSNLKSAQHFLQGEYSLAQEVDKKKDKASNGALWCLAIGMFCIMLFGAINI